MKELLFLLLPAVVSDRPDLLIGKKLLFSHLEEGGDCFDGSIYPANLQNYWNNDICYDNEGNQYQKGKVLQSCCGCFKLTCSATHPTSDEWKSFWNLTVTEETCCQNCHGKVFPVGSVMSKHVMEDDCSTTVTERCRLPSNGNSNKAARSLNFDYGSCCRDPNGLHPLFTIIPEPSSCSTRQCLRQDRGLYARWVLTTLHDGCNCCLYEGQLFPEGGNVRMKNGENATCCEGKLMVAVTTPENKSDDDPKKLEETTSITTATIEKQHVVKTEPPFTLATHINCYEDPLGAGKCPANSGCFNDELGIFGPAGEHGFCHCYLGFYPDGSTDPPTCKDMRGGGNCDQNGNSHICYRNDEHWEFCPYCSAKKRDEEDGGEISLGNYKYGEGNIHDNDPQIFQNGDDPNCVGRQRDTEMFWYCWYDAWRKPIVPLDSVELFGQESLECYFLVYVYTPLACCFADPEVEDQSVCAHVIG